MQNKRNRNNLIFAIIAVWIFSIFITIKLQKKDIVAVFDSAVAYADGTAEIVYHDSFNGEKTYKERIAAIKNGDLFSPPILTPVGSDHTHAVFTFFSGKGDQECQDSIFFINRTQKKSHVTNTNWCIIHTLDPNPNDITTFFAIKNPFEVQQIGLGRYTDGTILSSLELPSKLPFYNLMSPENNWENTQVIFAVGSCDPGGNDQTLYLWNIPKNTIQDVTPKNNAQNCGYNKKIIYQPAEKTFTLERERKSGITEYIPLRPNK